MDLRALYEAQTIDKGLKYTPYGQAAQFKENVANAIWETEIERRFKQFKKELKALGYKKVTFGKHPDWRTGFQGNMVFAEPCVILDGPYIRVGLWSGPCEIMGGMSCGNGRPNSDQAQLNLPPNAYKRFEGTHIL